MLFLWLSTKPRGVTAHSTVIVTPVAVRTVQNFGLRRAGKAHECMNSISSLSVNLWCGEDGPELHFTKAACVLQVSGDPGCLLRCRWVSTSTVLPVRGGFR